MAGVARGAALMLGHLVGLTESNVVITWLAESPLDLKESPLRPGVEVAVKNMFVKGMNGPRSREAATRPRGPAVAMWGVEN